MFIADDWGPQFSAENFAKFGEPVCKIPRLTVTKSWLKPNFVANHSLPFVIKLSSILFKNFSF